MSEHRTTHRNRKRSAFEPPEALVGSEAQLAASTRRPLATSLGAGFVIARALAGIVWLVAFVFSWREFAVEEAILEEVSAAVLSIVLTLGGVGVLVLLVLGVLIWRGSNGARVLVMISLTLSTITAAIGYFRNGEEVTIETTLLTLSFDILVLLALSSRDARAWARRRKRSNS